MKYNFNVKEGPIRVEWMSGTQTNICYNALGQRVSIRVTALATEQRARVQSRIQQHKSLLAPSTPTDGI